jgi:hypothetical protein
MERFWLDISQLQILEDGELPRGMYYYSVVALLPDSEVESANTLKIYCPNPGNTVGIFWDDVPGAVGYRVIRRGSDGVEGSILIEPPAFFHDNGLIVFNEA